MTGDLSEPVSRLTGGAESLDPGPDLTPAEPSCSPEKALPGWDELGKEKTDEKLRVNVLKEFFYKDCPGQGGELGSLSLSLFSLTSSALDHSATAPPNVHKEFDQILTSN